MNCMFATTAVVEKANARQGAAAEAAAKVGSLFATG